MDESMERVLRGAAWLDETAPGWERKLDLSVLDISDPGQCVCGQVFMGIHQNPYTEAVVRLKEEGHDFYGGGGYGFVHAEDGDAWVTLVKQRFDTGTLSG
jgi:hypothetical protein